MDDLERLAREIHNAHEGADCGWIYDESAFFGEGMQYGFNITDIQAKRNELSGKPKEWFNDWAVSRAQDDDGTWNEYKERAYLDNTGDDSEWNTTKLYSSVGGGEVLGDWRDTLEERVIEDKAVEWDGEGLPPVGCTMEVHNDDGYVLLYGHDVIGRSGEVKAVFMSGNVETVAIDIDGISY